jgi:hypothetical protein
MRERAQDAGSLAQALSDVTTRDEVLAHMARAFFDEVIAPRRADVRDAPVRSQATTIEPELAAMLVPWMMIGVALGYRPVWRNRQRPAIARGDRAGDAGNSARRTAAPNLRSMRWRCRALRRH